MRSRIALFPWLALVCLKEKWKWRVTLTSRTRFGEGATSVLLANPRGKTFP